MGFFFFFQAEDGIRDRLVTGVQTCALPISEIIGQSTAINDVFDKMRVVMGTDVTVMITGETGTGKELVARALHTKGPRDRKSVV